MWKDTVHSHTLYRPLYLGPPSPPLILGPAVWFSAANGDIRPQQCGSMQPIMILGPAVWFSAANSDMGNTFIWVPVDICLYQYPLFKMVAVLWFLTTEAVRCIELLIDF